MSNLKVPSPVVWGAWPSVEHSGGGMLLQADATQSIVSAADILTSDYRLHKRLLSGLGDDASSFRPNFYVRYSAYDNSLSSNSSSSMEAVARSYYDRAENTLASLFDATDEDGDPVVEKGAIETATSILGQLQTLEYAPPELSWHGGDAVVMLWANTDTTFAITVTEGEWGYVARREGKLIKLAHSIKLSALALEDLR